jgi:hypothetical protein
MAKREIGSHEKPVEKYFVQMYEHMALGGYFYTMYEHLNMLAH